MARKGERLLPQKFGAGLARGFFLGGTLRPVINHYVHPEVIGLENLAGLDPPLILAANHSSHMDTPLIVNSLPKELRHRTLVAAASDYFFSSRMLGLFVSLAVGAVPMDRRAASRQTMDKVDDLLEQKWCLVIYPEGSRTIDGRLYRGKTGIARLALSAHAPIVPVGVVGTYDAMPPPFLACSSSGPGALRQAADLRPLPARSGRPVGAAGHYRPGHVRDHDADRADLRGRVRVQGQGPAIEGRG